MVQGEYEAIQHNEIKWSAILVHAVREYASVSTKGLPQKVTRKPLMCPTYNLLNLFTLIIFRVPQQARATVTENRSNTFLVLSIKVH